MAASSSIPNITYQGVATLTFSSAITSGLTATGTVYMTPVYYVNFTVIAATQNAANIQMVTFTAQVPADHTPHSDVRGDVVFRLAPSSVEAVQTWPPTQITQVPLIQVGSDVQNSGARPIAVTATSALNGTSSSGLATLTPTSSEATTASTSPLTFPMITKPSYGAGTLAGVATTCGLAGIALTVLIFLICSRRKRLERKRPSKDTENKLHSLDSRQGATYPRQDIANSWERHLPQADSDVSLRTMATRTLDQIAMHVENYYTFRTNVSLSTDHRFELETINASPLSEPISTMLLLHCKGSEELIKHYISSYIISMINFEEGGSNASFLPKAFRKQWRPPSQNMSALIPAYSRWRVLTAYLRQQSRDDQEYIAERDAMIETAARHICKAFEPWAKADESARFQNMVGIMKRASELGIQLFSQPAKFEWQWFSPSKTDTAVIDNSLAGMFVLPGLYKTTDQNAVPLAVPLCLVNPVAAPQERF